MNRTVKKSLLYISYDGVLEPLGESQVITYLEPLSADYKIILMSYEKKNSDYPLAAALMKVRLSASDITWVPLTYHKSPSVLATAWDIFIGVLIGSMLCLNNKVKFIHARSYVACLISLILKKLINVKYLFDMRGFWVDERVDGGLWRSNSLLYKIAKYYEKRMLLSADHIVILSHAGLIELKQFAYMPDYFAATVIPTCVNNSRFYPYINPEYNSEVTLGYIGSVGTWYLFDEVLRSFRILLNLRSNAKLLILNRNEHQTIKNSLDKYGISFDQIKLLSVPHHEVPAYISLIDIGIFYIKPVFSKRASAPTKLAEFLACGVPCLTNSGIGDVDEVITFNKVGVIVDSFDDTKLTVALSQMLELLNDSTIGHRCVEVAKNNFSLEIGVRRYKSIYSTLVNPR